LNATGRDDVTAGCEDALTTLEQRTEGNGTVVVDASRNSECLKRATGIRSRDRRTAIPDENAHSTRIKRRDERDSTSVIDRRSSAKDERWKGGKRTTRIGDGRDSPAGASEDASLACLQVSCKRYDTSVVNGWRSIKAGKRTNNESNRRKNDGACQDRRGTYRQKTRHQQDVKECVTHRRPPDRNKQVEMMSHATVAGKQCSRHIL
jgi:hypothetical protein